MGGLLAVAGLFVIGVVIGIVVLTTAEASLMAVARAAARDSSRCFRAGVITQVVALPVLALLCLACGVTVVGLLAIPVVILLWLLALAGGITMGVLGVSTMLGVALVGTPRRRDDRPAALRALVTGLALFCLPWLVAAILDPMPGIGLAARVLVLAVSWALITTGLGAVVRSGVHTQFRVHFRRGGAAAPSVSGSWSDAASASSQPSWMTPTPVQGVAAARRVTSNTHE
jgi:hypothetical protein